MREAVVAPQSRATSIQARRWPVAAVRWLAVSTLFVACAAVSVMAHAQEGPGPGPMPGHRAMHGPMQGPGGPGMMMFGGSPEQIARHVDRMLDGLNATDAQRAQIKQIAQAAAADLKTQREATQGLHERSMQIFTAPTVDANAAESVRQQMLSAHDQMSRRMLQAMLDVSRVLTPEQRAKIGERMKQREAVMRDRMQRMQHEHGQRMAPPAKPQ
jgi:protein CpxP